MSRVDGGCRSHASHADSCERACACVLRVQYVEEVSAVAQLLAASALSSSDLDPWFYDDLYRCIDHFGMPEAVRRLR